MTRLMNQPTGEWRGLSMESDRLRADPLEYWAPVSALSFRVRESAGHVYVEVAGELDLATTAELQRELCRLVAPGRRIAVDLESLTFMDASGVGTCLAVQRDARALGCDIGFDRAAGIVARVLQLVELEE